MIVQYVKSSFSDAEAAFMRVTKGAIDRWIQCEAYVQPGKKPITIAEFPNSSAAVDTQTQLAERFILDVREKSERNGGTATLIFRSGAFQQSAILPLVRA